MSLFNNDEPTKEVRRNDVQQTGKTIEAWRDEKQTPAWMFGGARAANAWGEGRVLTEAEYDAAISRVGSARMLSGDLIERK